VIVALLLLSLYQCIQEEYSEYQTQRVAGNLPSDHSWYYYDYGMLIKCDFFISFEGNYESVGVIRFGLKFVFDREEIYFSGAHPFLS
jgi:hypothetical protein